MINRIKHKIHRIQKKRELDRVFRQIDKKKEIVQSVDIPKDNSPVVVCLLKNGAYFVQDFMEHYNRLGFQHFVFIDNGSTDETIEELQKYEVTILSCDLPYKDYKYGYKQYLVKAFANRRWSLYVDIDELWEYPYQDQLKLSTFLQYLDANKYTAVMSVMVDMFADLPLKELKTLKDKSLKEAYPYYDNSAMMITPYQKAYNTVNHPKTSHFRGGVHRQVFDIENIYLSKMPLIKWDESIEVHETSHSSVHVNIADVSTVLLHYKFVVGFYEKIQRVLEEKSYWNASETYQKYLSFIERHPDLNLKQASAKKYQKSEELEEENTVWISEDYKNWVAKNSTICAE